jgi:hypothetical protein
LKTNISQTGVSRVYAFLFIYKCLKKNTSENALPPEEARLVPMLLLLLLLLLLVNLQQDHCRSSAKDFVMQPFPRISIKMTNVQFVFFHF